MDSYKAFVKEEGENKSLCLVIKGKELKVPLTEDNPNAVKSVFNDLIILLKEGKFQFNIENPGSDLFSQVSKEYITQLNKELLEVYNELSHFKLLSKDAQVNA